ncbi:MAG: sigma-54-dependent Fis family transcriptional regulator [Candidatus Omnitrophica bacterium]|nr:sigma-54-dependent Fis family transcriptional regulator [Candidatus Omnitrophota bacterium]
MPNNEQSMEASHYILVVDNDQKMAKTLSRALQDLGYRCRIALSGDQGLNCVHQENFDLILTDLVMPGFDGITFVRSVKTIAPNIPIIMMTGHGSVDTAVKAMKAGAFDYLNKPIRFDELQVHVEQALASHEVLIQVQELKDRLKEFQTQNPIIGKSQAMRSIITQVEQIAPSTANVLITGETGTGKERIAEAIHILSPRSEKPIVKVNCGALPESLLESELFGHMKGAFTGAYKDHKGRFETANGGTIFLDEIGEMSPPAQVRLLRVLQEGQFERVGSSHTVYVDVRVLAATNCDLHERVLEGKFREDLLYRINVFHLILPPLRDRNGDIALLAQHFVEKYSQKNKKRILGVGQRAMRALEAYSWPGNVRELENVIEHGVIMSRGDRIQLEHLPGFFQNLNPRQSDFPSPSNGKIVIPLGFSAEQSEAIIICRTLEMTQGDKEAAAQILGFSTRTLYRKMKEHNISLEHGVNQAD